MATAYSEINDLFLQSAQDYQIDKLFSTSVSTAETFLLGFLIKAIPNFQGCRQDLENRNDTTRTFNIDLTTNEKVILSNLMLVEWWERQINDTRQVSLHINVGEAKHYAESQNLKAKSDAKKALLDTIEKQITKYQYDGLDLSVWY